MAEEQKQQKKWQKPEDKGPLTAEELNEQMQVRIEKMHKMEEMGVAPFGHRYEWTHHAQDVREQVDDLCDQEEKKVRVAGRLMAIRGHGKASFMDLYDKTGKIQVYARKDVLGDEAWPLVKLLDIGDIVGIEGTVFKTKMGEISIKVEKLDMLSKDLRVLPEKWHGLQDKELRYRQRYVDLIVNPEVRDTFVKRSQIINAVLNTIAGGAAARPFITYHNTLDMEMYLRIATELPLKRLIVGGMERVYEIGRIFRNEGIDYKHNPEFTTMESYEAFGDMHTVMALTEEIVSGCAQQVLGTMKITYEGTDIDLTPPWPRISMIDAVKQYSGLDFTAVRDVETAREMAKSIGVEYEESWGVGKIINACFDAKVEENLIQPVFITGHPKEISPLAKANAEDPFITDRFEGYIYGREICNGFSELNDPIDQRERFIKQMEERAAGDEEANMMDEDFLNALEYGLPPTGGLGIGIDRLVMFLTGATSIRDVLFFPTMKPIKQ